MILQHVEIVRFPLLFSFVVWFAFKGWGQELLRVHVSYGPLIQRLLKRYNPRGRSPVIRGLAHITGGGFVDNIPRVLPRTCNVKIRRGSWPVLPLFEIIARGGRVSEEEMHHVFNMGIGMVCIVQGSKTATILRSIVFL